MFLFISCILFFQPVLLWILLIQYKKSETNEEKFIEDNLQMKYLREFQNRKSK